jgi:hypothetical protein
MRYACVRRDVLWLPTTNYTRKHPVVKVDMPELPGCHFFSRASARRESPAGVLSTLVSMQKPVDDRRHAGRSLVLGQDLAGVQ